MKKDNKTKYKVIDRLEKKVKNISSIEGIENPIIDVFVNGYWRYRKRYVFIKVK